MIRVTVDFKGQKESARRVINCDDVVVNESARFITLQKRSIGEGERLRTIAVIPMDSVDIVDFGYSGGDVHDDAALPEFKAQILKTRPEPQQELHSQELHYDVMAHLNVPKYVYVVITGLADEDVWEFMFGKGELPECFVDRSLAMKSAQESVPLGTHLDLNAMNRAVYIEAAWTYNGRTTWVERLEVRS